MRKIQAKKNPKRENIIEALSFAQKITFAPLTFQAIGTMLDIGLLEYLDKHSANVEKIIKDLKLNDYIVSTLLSIAALAKIVKCENGKYSLTKRGEVFLYDEMTISNFNFIKDVCYLGASELTQSFLSESPKGLHKFIKKSETIYPLLPKLPSKIKKSWYEFDHLYSDNCFEEVFKIIFKKHKKIFDIGGNTGKFERICLKNNCDITMLDLSENINAAKNNLELKNCKFHSIDVLKDSPEYPDMKNSAILMSQFLDCFSKKQIIKILKDISKNIDNKSSIFILEPFTDNQTFNAAEYSLCHISLYFTCMANGVSKMYAKKEFEEIIKKAGLKITNIHSNISRFDYTLLECSK